MGRLPHCSSLSRSGHSERSGFSEVSKPEQSLGVRFLFDPFLARGLRYDGRCCLAGLEYKIPKTKSGRDAELDQLQHARPDLGVRDWRTKPQESPSPSTETLDAPDFEAVASLTLDPDRAVHIDRHGQLIAAIEIVSPRNKDRPEARERSSRRYAG